MVRGLRRLIDPRVLRGREAGHVSAGRAGRREAAGDDAEDKSKQGGGRLATCGAYGRSVARGDGTPEGGRCGRTRHAQINLSRRFHRFCTPEPTYTLVCEDPGLPAQFSACRPRPRTDEMRAGSSGLGPLGGSCRLVTVGATASQLDLSTEMRLLIPLPSYPPARI